MVQSLPSWAAQQLIEIWSATAAVERAGAPLYSASNTQFGRPLPRSFWTSILIDFSILFVQTDTPSITAKLINEQKEDKEKKNHEEKEKMKADSGFQDNYSVVVASGTSSAPHWYPTLTSSHSPAVTTSQLTHTLLAFNTSDVRFINDLDNYFFFNNQCSQSLNITLQRRITGQKQTINNLFSFLCVSLLLIVSVICTRLT